jgi:hypothetical protein
LAQDFCSATRQIFVCISGYSNKKTTPLMGKKTSQVAQFIFVLRLNSKYQVREGSMGLALRLNYE